MTNLLNRWRARSAQRGWPADLTWPLDAVHTVAEACLTGTDLFPALLELADQRLGSAATADDFERDLAALASCLPAIGLGPSPAELTAMAGRAARRIVARDAVLAHGTDPVTTVRTRAAFLHDLTSPGYDDADVHVWVARWEPGTAPWSSASVRTMIADRIRPHLRARESAGAVGPCDMAVLVTERARAEQLGELVRDLPGSSDLVLSIRRRPPGADPVRRAEWLLDLFPSLVDEPPL
ncbi:hypothetical protein [Amycolatopsis granulosa]|uniref:hypothetical protein n=1 Tax=Amycolatopsis granulosa TaxID=185684 RepID=UPI00141FE255|nr:hypothetical protein [Amycolatopsis granulosa]NIH84027.1 hypothetical protein [Amycolatopsis granulosa]